MNLTESMAKYIKIVDQLLNESIDNVKEAYPKQQLSLYNPNGKTYRGTGNQMPTLDPNDPVHDAERHNPDDINQSYAQDYEQDLDRERLKDEIQQILNLLTLREKEVMKLRFWKDLSLSEVGQLLGYSSERIRQIEARALSKLRHPSRLDRLRPYIEN